MVPRLFRVLCPAIVMALIGGQAWAAVTVTFYAHPGARVRDGYLLFPHAYLRAVGTLDDTGEAVDWAAGFTARNPGPQLLFARDRGEVKSPDARYIGEGRPYMSVTVDDDTYRAMRTRADWWASPEGQVYDLRRRNCITFVADLARVAGLRTGREPTMKPGRFLEDSAALNPDAAWGRPLHIQVGVWLND